MAHTVDSTTPTRFGALTETRLQLSGITASSLEAVAHGGPTGATPYKVTCNVTTQPTSQDPITLSWEGSSTSADTVSLRFLVPQGGDMTNAIVDVYVLFKDAASGGLAQ